MNKNVYIIIGLLTITLLSGCNNTTDTNNDYLQPTPITINQETRSNTNTHYLLANISELPSKSVELFLEENNTDPYTMVVTVKAKNPKKYNLQSVRTWLTYAPEKLQAVKIETKNSPFQIAAPEENMIDPESGLIKIGRANVSEKVQDEEIEIAKIVFVKKIQNDDATIIDFYNHKNSKGHTQANVVLNNQVINVAKKPNSPALIIRK
jgi:hypothetical protein